MSNPQQEVINHKNFLLSLNSFHKSTGTFYDWEKIIADKPFEEGSIGPNEIAAVHLRNSYKPNFLDKLFNSEAKKIAELEQNIIKAKEEDVKMFKKWENGVLVATNILKGDEEFYHLFIKESIGFQNIKNLGISYEPTYLSMKEIIFDFTTFSSNKLPNQEKHLTKKGMVSVKEMPIMKFNEFYKEYVCSGIVRIAREIFGNLPKLEKIYFNVKHTDIKKETGHYEGIYFISVPIDRKNLENINFNNLDCSSFIENLKPTWDFKKTKGFGAIHYIYVKQNEDEEIENLDKQTSNYGFVYFVKSSNGLVKIGKSKKPNKRISSNFGTIMPLEFETLYVLESANYSSTEALFHRHFMDKRMNGEWFELDEKDIEWILSGTYTEEILDSLN